MASSRRALKVAGWATCSAFCVEKSVPISIHVLPLSDLDSPIINADDRLQLGKLDAERLRAQRDGVFAFAMTAQVLELHLPAAMRHRNTFILVARTTRTLLVAERAGLIKAVGRTIRPPQLPTYHLAFALRRGTYGERLGLLGIHTGAV